MSAERYSTVTVCFASACLAVCAGCSVSRPRLSLGDTISATLQDQATAWNDGDIERFMEPYWHSDELTFSSSGEVTRGWQATLGRYRLRYPDRAAMGRLTFTDLEVMRLAPKVALVLGRWRLDRTEPVGGAFSLVFRRIDGRWAIIHDHTSVDPPEKSP